MLLEQLVQYAERLEREGKTLPFMYQETPVPWIVKLDAVGNFLDLERTSDGLNKKADRGKSMPAPKIKRQGAKAALLADDLEYVFDLANAETTPEMKVKSAQKRSLFIEETRACLEATEHPDVQAVLIYLEQLPKNAPEFPEGTSLKEKVTFEIEGRKVIAQKAVQEFWASKYADDTEDLPETSSKNAPLIAECLITGQVGPVMRREPLSVKSSLIPNSHGNGTGFISADKKPFESYGLRNSEIAPIRTEVAVKYATALNILLGQPHTHLCIAPVVFAFWTRNVPIPDVPGFLSKPAGHELLQKLKSGQGIGADLQVKTDANQVRRMISSAFIGNVFADLPADEFYCISLSAYISRIVVRDHVVTSLHDVGAHLAAYIAKQRLIGAEPQGLDDLSKSLFFHNKKGVLKGAVTSDVPDAILWFALKGTPLPTSFLNKLINRLRAESGAPRFLQITRAVLTRMTLISMEEIRMDELIALQPDHKSPGYQLGRLMAALENLQWLALVKYGSSSKINTTVTDRFYGSLSSTPVLVFANVMAGAQDHLSRIRKSDPGAFAGEDKRIGQILGYVQTVPDVLEPVDQAFFSLGYYHEKADRFARIQEAKDKKDNSNPNEGANT